MARRVLIAANVEPSLIDLLQQDPRFEVVQGRLSDLAPNCDILITRTFNKVTDAVMNTAPDLRVIAQGTSGTDNIDAAAAQRRGIAVISLPGINANAVAELVIGYMIDLTRTVPAYTRQVANGAWIRDDCATRHELRHYRLGIVGLGQVGKCVPLPPIPTSAMPISRSAECVACGHSMSCWPRATSSRCTSRSPRRPTR
jgi:phosphoglycerate dehydrogenase-like enzyme